MLEERQRHARALFAGIAAAYDRPAEILSLGQYGRWRRALLEAMDPQPGAFVLDVATGTGAIARSFEQRGAHVIGLDQSVAMLDGSPARAARPLVAADALAIPFDEGTFDAVTFSYLLRYVPDPASALRELVRVLRPGGMLGSVEFGLPERAWARLGWRAYARGIFPAACAMFGPGWRRVGGFLPGSIEAWERAWPVARQIRAWSDTGIEQIGVRVLTLGSGVVMVGRKHGAP